MKRNNLVRKTQRFFVFAALVIGLLAAFGSESFAATSKACEGGGFTVLGLSGKQDRKYNSGVPATFLVKGKYVEFTVDAATFGVRNWTLTGAANPLDITGGRRTLVFTAKIPNHRGLFLSSDISVRISKEALVLERTGSGLSMKIQVKDCANGGVF